MDDLQMRARMFEASAKLQRTSKLLVKLADGGKLGEREKELFTWTGSYLYQVDWDIEPPIQSGLALDAHATVTRPSFYRVLVGFGSRFSDLGIKTTEDLRVFFSKFYETLMSHDISDPGMHSNEVRVASELLSKFSHDLLGAITNDGAPIKTNEFRLVQAL